MEAGAVNMHKIWRETLNRLDSFSGRVREGRDVNAASEFARFLKFSGIIMLCKANEALEPLKCDGAFLQWKCDELLDACNDFFRTNGQTAGLKEPHLLSLHDKVDRLARNLELVAGHVSRLPLPPATSVTATASDSAGAGVGGGAAAPCPLPLPCQSVTTSTVEN